MPSNTIIVHGVEYDASPLKVENWTAGGGERDYRFKNQKRNVPITEIIVHETVTCSELSTVQVLEPAGPKNPGGRNLGIHFIVEPNGTITQHGDLADDFLWHATMHNPVSIGIETVNPYEPRLAPKNGPWTQIMNAPWAAGGKYVVPTIEEAEAVAGILAWCTRTDCPPQLKIPLNFIGLKNGKMALGRVEGATNLVPGIYSHMYFEHADGAWLVLYAWLRLVVGLSPTDAFTEAVVRATGASSAGADVSDLIPNDESPTS